MAGQGQLACEQKQFRKAEEHLKAAIAVHESLSLHLSGRDQQFHYSLLASYYNSLGIVLRSLHKFAEAEKQFVTSVKIYGDRLGKTTPELIPPSFNLAALYAEQQDWAKASSSFVRVKELAQKNASATHPIWGDIKQFEADLQKYANAAAK